MTSPARNREGQDPLITSEADGGPDVSGEQLRRLLVSTKVIPWVANAHSWRFTYVGTQVEALLGYPRERWYENDFWVSHLHPDDREEAVAYCLENSETCREYEFDYRMISAAGQTVWLRDVVTVETVDGVPSELRGFFVDITAHKQTERELRDSEAKFRGFAERSRAGIMTTDGTRCTYVNPRFAEITGFSQAELLRMSPLDLIIPESREMIADRVLARIRGESEPSQYETQILTKHGKRRWIEVSVTRVTAGEDPVSLCTIVDTTDRKVTEAAAADLRDQLAHVTRLATLGELASMLAHEVNQPLAALLSNAQAGLRWMKQEPLDTEELKATFDDIVADASRAGAIIQRLRTLVRKRPSERHPIDLHELVHEVVQLVAADLRLKMIDIRHDLAADLPPVVGDRVQLQQVVLNLTVNAIEAIESIGDEGTGKIALQAASTDREVTLMVEDNGAGVEEADAATIFDPFMTTKSEGMGMGLSISRTIVEAHGGRLWATRNSERGATFHLSLPCHAPEVDDA